jgi:hypothetical protein
MVINTYYKLKLRDTVKENSIILSYLILNFFYRIDLCSVFQGFSKAKSANGGSILSSSQFLILPQLPQKMKLTSKVVKIDPKIIVLLPRI